MLLHIDMFAFPRSCMQALSLLQGKFPIERARMRLQVVAPGVSKKDVLDMLGNHQAEVMDCQEIDTVAGNDALGGVSVTCLVEPGGFRKIFNFMNETLGTRATVQVTFICL